MSWRRPQIVTVRPTHEAEPARARQTALSQAGYSPIILILIVARRPGGLGVANCNLLGGTALDVSLLFTPLAIIFSTLASPPSFTRSAPPARLHGRRFYRRKYDANQTLEALSTQLRNDIDIDEPTTELIAVVHQTMQPAHASLWLRASTEPPRSAGFSPQSDSVV